MAKKKIQIGNKEVEFKATAATPIYYRTLFHREFMRDMEKLAKTFEEHKEEGEMPLESLEIFEDVAYCMAKQAAPSIGDKIDWFDGFDMFSIYEVLPHIIELWGVNQSSMVNIKKNCP